MERIKDAIWWICTSQTAGIIVLILAVLLVAWLIAEVVISIRFTDRIKETNEELARTTDRVNKLEAQLNVARIDQFFYTMEEFRNGTDK